MRKMRFKHANSDRILFKWPFNSRLSWSQCISHRFLQLFKVTALSCCHCYRLRSQTQVIPCRFFLLRKFSKVMKHSGGIQVHHIDVWPTFRSFLKVLSGKLHKNWIVFHQVSQDFIFIQLNKAIKLLISKYQRGTIIGVFLVFVEVVYSGFLLFFGYTSFVLFFNDSLTKSVYYRFFSIW